jgi:hypothetical protein
MISHKRCEGRNRYTSKRYNITYNDVQDTMHDNRRFVNTK